MKKLRIVVRVRFLPGGPLSVPLWLDCENNIIANKNTLMTTTQHVQNAAVFDSIDRAQRAADIYMIRWKGSEAMAVREEYEPALSRKLPLDCMGREHLITEIVRLLEACANSDAMLLRCMSESDAYRKQLNVVRERCSELREEKIVITRAACAILRLWDEDKPEDTEPPKILDSPWSLAIKELRTVLLEGY